MPRKRKGADLSRSTSKARNLRNSRSERTEEQIQQQNTDARVRMAQLHQEEPEDTRAERNEVRRLEQRQSRRFTVSRRRTNDQQRQQPTVFCDVCDHMDIARREIFGPVRQIMKFSQIDEHLERANDTQQDQRTCVSRLMRSRKTC
ncbi:unnamed protein product [Parnassius apollo]|uniref:(apollo) hypothetical protein n=1 Tax=Parnassius apollo TaxID=110799 RepID=A0A8S3Y0F1_PARAO|nr:unnamed protein product [Parnassius apollo]